MSKLLKKLRRSRRRPHSQVPTPPSPENPPVSPEPAPISKPPAVTPNNYKVSTVPTPQPDENPVPTVVTSKIVETPASPVTKPQISRPFASPNGCTVARRVSRDEAGCPPPSNCIAAIDFGTSNCSVAYILPGESPEKGPNILAFQSLRHVPTAVLFSKDGIVRLMGDVARKMYRTLTAEEMDKQAYFEQIKMNLQHDETVNRKSTVKAMNGKEYYLVDVIAHTLKYLKDQLIRKLKSAGIGYLQATDFDWVITVPAIWRARGKQMMREAGYKAGLCSKESCPALQVATSHSPQSVEEEHPDKLSLALEPDCAAIFCQYMTEQYTTPYPSTYIIVDIGGGTVDITAHSLQLQPLKHIHVVMSPTGNDCGGSRVNKEFRTFLEVLVHDKGFATYIATPDHEKNVLHKAHLHQIVNNFEIEKIRFGDTEGGCDDVSLFSVDLQLDFLETYKVAIEESTADDSDVELVGMELRISYEKMESFFTDTTDKIIQCIEGVIKKVKNVDKMYLVGGFGGCKYMANVIEKHFEIKCVIPFEAAYAVVKGAVVYKHNPSVIKSRRADATYGQSAILRFDKRIHDPKYRRMYSDDDVPRCHSLFQTVVERDEVVESNEVFVSTFIPAQNNQKNMYIKFYSSPDTDFFYITGERRMGSRKPLATVTKLGSIILDLPEPESDSTREVDVTFDFSHAEILVKAFDKTCKKEVKTVLDFLE